MQRVVASGFRSRFTACAMMLGCAGFAATADFLETTLSGHFDDSGSFLATAPSTENYSCGRFMFPGSDLFYTRRNFFAFDLAAIPTHVTTAFLVMPVGDFGPPGSGHPYMLASGSYSLEEMMDPFGVGPGDPIDVFMTMGKPDPASGREFLGDAYMSAIDFPGPYAEVHIPISIDYINDHLGEEIVITGRVSDDEEPIPGTRNLFKFTNPGDIIDSGLGMTARPRIEYTLVPAPAALILGLLLPLARKRRH